MDRGLVRFVCLVLLFGLIGTSGAAAESVELSNEFLSVRIASRGGRIERFIYRRFDAEKDWVLPVPHEGYGLALDHFVCQTWPGELLGAEYALRRRDGTAVAAYTVRGRWKGKDFPDIRGLKIVKEIRLAQDFPAARVKVRVQNPTGKLKSFQFWAQQIFGACGASEHDAFLRPTTRGVLKTPYPGSAAAERFLTDVTAGWMARIDEEQKVGLALLMDYDRLQKLYNVFKAGTSEWMYYKTALPPGKTWETEYCIRPFRGFRALDFASEDLLVNLVWHAAASIRGGTDLDVEMAAATGPLKDVRVAIEALDPVSYEPKDSASFHLDRLSAEKVSRFVRLKICDRARWIYRIRYDVEGRRRSAVVNPFFSRNNYRIKPPRKRPKLFKPELSKLKGRIESSRRCLLVKGLFYDKWRIGDVLRSLGFQVEALDSYDDIFGYHIQGFPQTYEELFGYRLVALMNVAVSGLSPGQQVMLKDYVLSGGALIVFGGLYGYGRGGYAEAVFEEVVPVRPDGPFDIMLLEEPAPMRSTSALAKPGLESSASLSVLAYHRVRPKDGAAVLTRVSDAPVVTAWRRGEGKCCAVSATLLGDYPSSRTPFWEQEAWGSLLRQLVRWMIGLKGEK